MKIAVFGNCQRSGVAKTLQILNRAIYAEEFELTADFDPVAKLSDKDVICAHLNLPDSIREYANTSGKRLIFYPRITFPAFHPDMSYINRVGGIAIPTAFSSYNSVLAFFGWRNGLSVEQTTKLFTDKVFQQIGYYNDIEPSRQALLKEGVDTGFDLAPLLDKWSRKGCFMHTLNHPKLTILIDVAREIIKKLDISCEVNDPEPFLLDQLVNSAIWPVYPEIAGKLGFEGSYLFKTTISPTPAKYVEILSLREMVEKSFETYSAYKPEDLWCPRAESAPFAEILKWISAGSLEAISTPDISASSSMTAEEKKKRASRNPYSSLPPYQFWRKAIETVAMTDVDPVVRGAFQIKKSEKVATAGSCFAQHISRTLSNSGFDYYIPEVSNGMPMAEAARRNYGVFSARFGNIYTTRQLVQLFDRAYGAFVPEEEAWLRPDGRFVDPFRPQIEPDGFETVLDVRASRETHLSAVRDMFENLDILVFTLGLTEGWRSKEDGAVFPLAPGVSGGELDPARHEFINFTASEISDDLKLFLAKLKTVNPDARVILTVSPVPLIATYENRHVLVSNTYSKAALRVAAEEAAHSHDNVTYFPSFEIITGNYNRSDYYEPDLRSVRPEGVAHVMRLFMQHYSGEAAKPQLPSVSSGELDDRTQELLKQRDIVCDEEEIMSWSRT